MAEPGQTAITCDQVTGFMQPCLRYLLSGGRRGEACCNEVRNLQGVAKTAADKRIACNCVKAALNRPGLNNVAASNLPRDCGVTIEFPISQTANCDA